MRVRNWHAPPFVACFLAMLALVAFIAVPAFADSAGPPGVTTNDTQFATPATLDTGQSITFADIAFGTGTNTITATANVAVEPKTLVAYANSGTVNVNDSSPPAGYAAQNIVVTSTSAAQTIKEAHSDVILHGNHGQILLTATSLVRGVEYNLLC